MEEKSTATDESHDRDALRREFGILLARRPMMDPRDWELMMLSSGVTVEEARLFAGLDLIMKLVAHGREAPALETFSLKCRDIILNRVVGRWLKHQSDLEGFLAELARRKNQER